MSVRFEGVPEQAEALSIAWGFHRFFSFWSVAAFLVWTCSSEQAFLVELGGVKFREQDFSFQIVLLQGQEHMLLVMKGRVFYCREVSE